MQLSCSQIRDVTLWAVRVEQSDEGFSLYFENLVKQIEKLL